MGTEHSNFSNFGLGSGSDSDSASSSVVESLFTPSSSAASSGSTRQGSQRPNSNEKSRKNKEAQEMIPEEIISDITRRFHRKYEGIELSEMELIKMGEDKISKHLKDINSTLSKSEDFFLLESIKEEEEEDDDDDEILSSELEKKEELLELLYLFNLVLQKNPMSFEGYMWRGICFLVLSQNEKNLKNQYLRFSLHDLKKCIYIEPWKDSKAYFCRAITYKKLGMIEKSLLDFSKSVEMNPSNTFCWIELGEIFLKKYEEGKKKNDNNNNNKKNEKNIDECIRYFENAIRLDPSRLDVSKKLGKIQIEVGRLEDAIQTFSNCVKFNKEDFKGYFFLGEIYYLIKDFKNSIINYQESLNILEKKKKKKDFNNIKSKDQNNNNIEEEEKENITKSLCGIGKSYFSLQEYNKSIDYLERSIQINPNNEMDYVLKSRCLKKLKKINEALEVLEEGEEKIKKKYLNLNNNKKNKNFLEKIYYEKGVLYFHRGEYEKAVKVFNRVVGMNPTYAKVYINRGNCYYCQKKFGNALNDYEDALRLDSSSSESFGNKGVILWMIHRDYESAIFDFSKCYEINPNNEMNKINMRDCSKQYIQILEKKISEIERNNNNNNNNQESQKLKKLKIKKEKIESILSLIDK